MPRLPRQTGLPLCALHPEGETSGIVVDAFDNGSYIKVLPQQKAIVGYTTKNSGGVPDNFRNWFVLTFDKEFESVSIFDGPSHELSNCKGDGSCEVTSDHAIASVRFSTRRGEQVNVQAASSFISLEQAWLNLKEVSDKSFEQVKNEAKDRWNEVLGRIEVAGGTVDQYRTFYMPVQERIVPAQVL